MNLAQQFNQPENTPLHSNGYGEVSGADGSAVGDVGMSLEQRKALEARRRYIMNYKSSALGGSYVPPEARHYKTRQASGLTIGQRDAVTPTDNISRRQAANAGESLPPTHRQSRTNFREPSGRGYNPYS